MSAEAVSAAVPVAALLLGIINLWYGVLRPWWRNRSADPDARLELVTYQTRNGWQQDERIVLTNRGPAKMTDVRVLVNDDGGQDYTNEVGALWPRQPVAVVHPGQTLQLKLERTLAHNRPGSLLVRWRDGRRGRQEREFWLTYHQVP
ncbi:hypothetical protein [Micromonospora globispora]|uniref:hypothetical protein n=1 Tax=Micromonospora globispora TaxID=1450148 RepID=UPI000F4EAA2F|nr:hypothetical protein [Micromonospora globispora]